MLRKMVYPKIETLLNSMAGFLHQKGFTPNQLTFAGLGLNVVSGALFMLGLFPAAGLTLLVAGLGDMLDGALARTSGRASKFGAFLDSVVDRYSDFFVFGGLAGHFAVTGRMGWFLLVMGIIAGGFVTSYSKARAENFISSCSVGVFERPERLIALAVGAILPGFMGLVIWVLFFGTQVTAIHRILYTKSLLAEPAAPRPDSPAAL
ncbi:MAG: hypothetical protein A2Y02_03260 [Omnitrophica bacterium GWA2_52_12]|nr:MAG: hypothetical protein A2Y02_03260 [Omnitrophica bacterium GWA2_52_12]